MKASTCAHVKEHPKQVLCPKTSPVLCISDRKTLLRMKDNDDDRLQRVRASSNGPNSPVGGDRTTLEVSARFSVTVGRRIVTSSASFDGKVPVAG